MSEDPYADDNAGSLADYLNDESVAPATSSDAESLRGQIATALEADDVGRGYRARAKRFYRGQADALIAAVPALQHASSDLHGADRLLIASLVSFALAAPSNDASVAARDRVVAEARALLDTAQPDLGRTPEAEAIAEALMEARYPDDGSRQRAAWIKSPAAEVPWSIARRDAAVVVAKLAATPAPAEEELDPITYFKEQLPDALDAMAEDQAKYDALPLPKPAPAEEE